MVCDLAETYNIYDYKQLPVERAAVFVCGLREDARIWRAFGYKDIDRELQTMIYDKLNWIAWTKTEAAQDGQAPPERLFDKLFGEPKENPENTMQFNSPEEFKQEWERITNGNNDRGRICPDNTIG